AEFERLHKAQFSFLMDRPLIIEAVSVEATARSAEATLPTVQRTEPAAPIGTVRLYADGWHDARLYQRESLAVDQVVEGPAIITEANSTTVVDPGWRARCIEQGHLVVERVRTQESAEVG